MLSCWRIKKHFDRILGTTAGVGGQELRLFGLDLRCIAARLERLYKSTRRILAKATWPYDSEATGLLLGTVALVVAASLHSAVNPAPFLKPLAHGRLSVLGFYENESTTGTSRESLVTNIHHVDAVLPFWASLGQDGSVLAQRHDLEVVRFAHENDTPVFVVINNEKIPGTGNVQMISDTWLRKQSVESISKYVHDIGCDGVHISFELMPQQAKPAFSAFIRDLALSMRAQHKSIGVSVFPPVDLPENVWGVFDYASLASDADYVVLHAFDRHWLFTAPGPIAPQEWVEKSVSTVLRSVPAPKLILGVGFYGYDWPARLPGGATLYLPTTEALRRAQVHAARIQFDEQSQQPGYRYTQDGAERVVWFQDTTNLEQKADLALRSGLGGIALWRLGFEPEDAWEVVDSYR